MRSDHSTAARPSRRTRASSREKKTRHHCTTPHSAMAQQHAEIGVADQPLRSNPRAPESTEPSATMNSLHLRLPPETANLLGPSACLRELARPHLGALVAHHLPPGDPAQPLLGLDIRSVGDQHIATGGVGAVDRAVLL